MNQDKMKKIVLEEVENFKINESGFDGLSKKADMLHAISDFGSAIEKFEEKMTIQMKNSFDPILDQLKALLNDVGKNSDSYMDSDKKRRTVILKKSNEDVVSESSGIKFFDKLEDSLKKK